MRILLDIGHPAHVHFFKNTIWNLENKGHEVLITARDKDVSIDLLKDYNINHVVVGKISNTKLGLIAEWIKRDYKIYKIAKKFKPDILMGILNPCAAHASKILGKSAIIFNDSEVVSSTAAITYPFVNVIWTPSNFAKSLGTKQVRFDGYKEFAYLHPNYFCPNPSIFKKLGINPKDKYVVMRFVAWKAGHDMNQKGFDLEMKMKYIREIEKYARVFISSESDLSPELEPYRISLPPSKMHDLISYAQLLIGDSQTMTTEAAVLGTPAIRCNSFVGENDMSNFKELEHEYGLIFNFSDPESALEKAVKLLQTPGLKEEWKDKKERLLQDKIDVTGFMTWFVENYPNSFLTMKRNPDFQSHFKTGSWESMTENHKQKDGSQIETDQEDVPALPELVNNPRTIPKTV